MRKHRFFVSPSQFAGNLVHIVGEDARQIRLVLRLQPGDEIGVLDGSGTEYRCVLKAVGKGEVLAQVCGAVQLAVEPRVDITVVQALAKGEKVEWVIQHGTEIGVSRFLLVETERSVLKLDGHRQQNRLERWQRIAKEASEQAHRARVPDVSGVLSLPEALEECTDAAIAVLHPAHDSLSLADWMQQSSLLHRVCVVVGPEGGLTDGEVALCEQYGASAVSLMPRVLRTETAALVAVSQILFFADVAHKG